MKTPKNSPKEQTAVRFEKRTLDRLEAVKERTGLSVGYMIRQSVEAMLPQWESDKMLRVGK